MTTTSAPREDPGERMTYVVSLNGGKHGYPRVRITRRNHKYFTFLFPPWILLGKHVRLLISRYLNRTADCGCKHAYSYTYIIVIIIMTISRGEDILVFSAKSRRRRIRKYVVRKTLRLHRRLLLKITRYCILRNYNGLDTTVAFITI